jgi:hypothetical protein
LSIIQKPVSKSWATAKTELKIDRSTAAALSLASGRMSQIRAVVQNQSRFLLFARTFLTGLCSLSSGLLAPRTGRNRKGQAMSTKTMRNARTLIVAGILGVGGAVAIATASPSWAMPALSNTAAVRTAESNPLTDVHYCRRGYHRHRYYWPGYYGGGYGYPYWYNPYTYYYPYYYTYYYTYPFYGFGGWFW